MILLVMVFAALLLVLVALVAAVRLGVGPAAVASPRAVPVPVRVGRAGPRRR